MSDFSVQPPAPLTMDTVTISFSIKNTTAQPITLGKEQGLFVGARYAESTFKRENRDFGYLSLGVTIPPGQSIKFSDSRLVDSPGQWTFWPVAEIAGDFVAFEQTTMSIVVKPRGAAASAPPSLGPGKSVVHYQGQSVSVQVFPPDSPWNQDVSGLPVHPMSDQWISNIGRGTSLHPDFGSGMRGRRPHRHSIRRGRRSSAARECLL
ncbi:MAG: hypothetical protein U0Q11_14430 [Vicinamibacterales bacterium]